MNKPDKLKQDAIGNAIREIYSNQWFSSDFDIRITDDLKETLGDLYDKGKQDGKNE